MSDDHTESADEANKNLGRGRNAIIAIVSLVCLLIVVALAVGLGVGIKPEIEYVYVTSTTKVSSTTPTSLPSTLIDTSTTKVHTAQPSSLPTTTGTSATRVSSTTSTSLPTTQVTSKTKAPSPTPTSLMTTAAASTTKIPSTTPTSLLTTTGFCEKGVHYQDLCYFAILHTRRDVNYNEAMDNCRAKSGTPADILDSTHYNMIFEYIRSLTSSARRYLWLGMTINPKTKVVGLTNGTRAPYVKYKPHYPSSNQLSTQMVIAVHRNSTDLDQGMWNSKPTNNEHGVLCQK